MTKNSSIIQLLFALILVASVIRPGSASGFRGATESTDHNDLNISAEDVLETFPILNGKPFNCTNQVETVTVVGKNDEDVKVKCKNKPTEKLDRTVCRQFNKANDPKAALPVWMVSTLG